MNPAKSLHMDKEPLSSGPRLRIVQADMRASREQSHSLETGRVVARGESGFTVRLETREVLASRAASCLLAPEPGDKVLLLREGSGECFVLHVLLKANPDSRLDFDGQVRLEAPVVSIEGTNQVRLQGAEVDLRGVQGRVSFLRLDLAARNCHARIKKLRAVAATVTQRLGDCLRLVGEERVKAGRLKTHVRGRWSVNAQDAELTAEKDVKVDGEQILLG